MPSILILANRIPYPLHDGGAMAMDAMIRGYAGAGWQVHLLSMNTSRHPVAPDTFRKLYPEIAGFHAVAVDNKVRVAGILKNFLFSREPEHVGRFRSPAFSRALAGPLQHASPDAVQLESPFLGAYLPEIRRHAPRARIVYRMHNVEGQIWERLARESAGLKRFYLRSLSARMAAYERGLWAEADLLLPITTADAAAVRAAGVDTPVEVAPFGIGVPGGRASLPGGSFRVYHIGAMDWLPNVEAIRWFLREVWPGVYAGAPELTFHFAGRGMPPSFRVNLPLGAVCAGEVDNAAAFVGDKHILVVPLRSGGGIRVKILEAMALGKLVISTDTGMQGIEAEGGRHYLKANTAQEFILGITWAAHHPEEAAAIAAAGQQLVAEAYDAKAIMQRVSTRLRTLLKD